MSAKVCQLFTDTPPQERQGQERSPSSAPHLSPSNEKSIGKEDALGTRKSNKEKYNETLTVYYEIIVLLTCAVLCDH